jgi:RHS repeat-associated protein
MWLDASVGLYYVRARVYDAGVGRFLSNDPAAGWRTVPERWEGSRAYRGCGTCWRDPTGHYSVQEFMASTVVQTTLATLNFLSVLRGMFAVLRVTSTGRITVDDALDIGFGLLGAGGLGLGLRALGAGGPLVSGTRGILRATSQTLDVRPARIVRTLSHGEVLADLIEETARLAHTSGVEHALVVTGDGRRLIVAGGRDGINVERLGVRTVIAHTHPPGYWDPSIADIGMLHHFLQPWSYIVHLAEDGSWVVTQFDRLTPPG